MKKKSRAGLTYQRPVQVLEVPEEKLLEGRF